MLTTWESPLLNNHFYNEAWSESILSLFQYFRGYSPGILSNSLQMWLGHLQCVMCWSWSHACIPFQHTGGVSNHILELLILACDFLLKTKKSQYGFISLSVGLWVPNFLLFLQMHSPTWPTLFTCKILFFPIHLSFKPAKCTRIKL